MLNHRQIQFGNPDVSPDQVHHQDFATLLPSLQSESIQCIYIDPPFGTGILRRNPNSQQEYQDKPGNPESFIPWIRPCLEESHRLLDAQGSLFVHLDYRAVHYVKVELDRIFGRQRFVNEIIWCYSVGGRSKKRFARKHDNILWYSKSKDYRFFPQAVSVPRKASSHMKVVVDENGNEYQEKRDRKTGRIYRYPVEQGKVPEDWWTDIETLNRSDKERVGWPTQKPTRLLERIVGACTEPGDRIADWFSGSGTTAAVAQKNGRSFVVCDRSEAAVDCTTRRLQAQGEALATEGTPPPDLRVFM